MAVTGTPRMVTDGLVLYLDAANTKSYPGSGTTWTDLSGRNNNGTLINGPTYNSTNAGGILFDGTNDHGSIAYSSTLDFPTGLTISVWFFSGNTSGSLYLKGRTDVDHYNPYIQTTGNYGWVGANGRAFYTPSSGWIQPNTWYNLTISHRSGVTPNIYRNNSLSTSHTFTEGNGTYVLGTNVNPVGINADIPRPFIYNFNGIISSIQVYNRDLSGAEISQNFEATRERFGV